MVTDRSAFSGKRVVNLISFKSLYNGLLRRIVITSPRTNVARKNAFVRIEIGTGEQSYSDKTGINVLFASIDTNQQISQLVRITLQSKIKINF